MTATILYDGTNDECNVLRCRVHILKWEFGGPVVLRRVRTTARAGDACLGQAVDKERDWGGVGGGNSGNMKTAMDPEFRRDSTPLPN